MSKSITCKFTSFNKSVPEILHLSKASEIFSEQSAILLKPNLVNDSPHPITTSAEFCEEVIKFIRSCSSAEIVIGEGCGDTDLETPEIFSSLGYDSLSKRYNVKLIDLNYEPLRRIENKNCHVFPEMFLPEIAFTHFILSLPVLKAHSLSTYTGTLKNMIGFAPPEHYSGQFGIWKKALFHKHMQESIIDLNQYRTPDFTLLDGSIGLSEFHLGGPHCSPPLKTLIAGSDPVEVDRTGAALLGLDWRTIPHLAGIRTEG